MDLPTYERYRRQHRARLIAHRRARSLMLGPSMQLQFEDEITVRYQMQEVLRAGRIVAAPEVEAEIAPYRHLLPRGGEGVATLLIEWPGAVQRQARLPLLTEAAHRIFVDIGRLPRVFASANEDLADRHLERPSAVHFLRFALPEQAHALLFSCPSVIVGCADCKYLWRRPLAPRTRNLLRNDLLPVLVPMLRDAPPAAQPTYSTQP